MPKFVKGSARSASMRASMLKAGSSALAIAICLFALSPICHAQADDAGTNGVQAGQNSAQTQGTDSEATPTQPGVRVVRLSDVEGTVQILRGDQTQFPQAVMNMPLAQGSEIKTGPDGRAEIEFEDGSVARITPNSSLKINALQTSSDGTMATTVEQLSGLIYYELRSDPKSPFNVTFGDRTATPTANSTFRVNLTTTPQELAVIDGRVQVQDSAHSYLAEVPQGKTIQFQGSDDAKYTLANWVAPNGFDDWNDQRDQEAAKEANNQTPARVQQGGGSIMDSGLGWSDLDNAGGWYPLPGYGMVWQPYGAGPGFDPYGNGMWANFGGGFGYSWVSGYPWGWLPFHCGSWSYIGSFGWGWMPGAYGCGGYGFGYGGYYGFRRRGWHGRYLRTNVYRGPAGYHAPVPPATVKGQPAQRIIRVGNQQPGMRTADLRTARGNGGHGNNAARPVNFNGTKVAPLHSMMAGVRVPTRNAALYNNYPAHAYQGGNVRAALLNHNASAAHGMAPGSGIRGSGIRGVSGASRRGSVNVARGEPLANRPFGGANRAAFGGSNRPAFAGNNRAAFGGNRAAFGGNRAAFGQHTSFGSHGSFGGARSSFAGGGFRSGGGFHNSGGFRGGGASRSGGFSGASSRGGGMAGGGFHGGGGGGGFHGGGGGAVGGGGHTAH